MHRVLFTATALSVTRLCVMRDLRAGTITAGNLGKDAESRASRHVIPSGRNLLDAVFVERANGEHQAAVLICHGIGEVVEHWVGVQRLLAEAGVASLVFDYSGYGGSSGWPSAAQCERDAVAAFAYLQALVPEMPVSLLGFSLGSGIAAEVLPQVKANRLVLFAAFTSYRAAARSLGVPVRLRFLVSNIWNSMENLASCPVPVLVVHGTGDGLFPVQMALDLHERGGADSELVIVQGLGHSEPFYRPDPQYWGMIARWLTRKRAQGARSDRQPRYT
ncbi:alpha/beta hydrolase [Acidicapsa ligni]|uniref:alpha/beta hydrolase n=1 Tax=Acidicapsa ligni TaxID=542300 RepID=UPI0021E0291E|nr:lysophospholipase [Acidicapsa ligni]